MRECGWLVGLVGLVCGSTVGAPLVHEGVIDAPMSDVWHALTTKEGLESWMVPHAEIELKVGGKMRTNYHADGRIGDANTIENTILSFEPERMLSLKATKPPADFPFKEAIRDMWSVMYLRPAGEGRTHLRIVGLGYEAGDEESQRMRAFFGQGNAWTLRQLQKKFADASGRGSDGEGAQERPGGGAGQSDAVDSGAGGQGGGDGEVALRLLRRLIGGEWIVEVENGDGSVFRARNVLENGPDGNSIVGKAWLGDAEGMWYHGSTQVWVEPGSGELRFQNINEQGAVARGTIRPAGADAVLWHWDAVEPDGREASFRVRMALEGPDSYRMQLLRVGADGGLRQLNDLSFSRVERAPARFRRLNTDR